MKNKTWTLLFWLLLCVQIMTAIYFCCQKQGFHEDEFYSFYSTSRTFGLSVPDGDWLDHDDYYNEFVVLDGQRFQYGLVKLVQSWDVHPPLYYWVLHTVCSLFTGQFSKWLGLVINLVAYGIGMILLRQIILKLTSHNEKLVVIICGFYGFSPAIMSIVVFIRMYALLTVFVYLCTLLHINAITHHENENKALSLKSFLIPIALVTYLGFLTQYYYFIFIFFMGFGFCVYLLWRDRNLKNCFRYIISVGIAFALGYITYPSCLGQMFRGQRGAQATSNFFDISNTLTRFKFFWDVMNDYVFGNLALLFIIILAVLAIIAIIRKSVIKPSIQYSLLLFSIIGYFLAVSKTALMLGGTSIRYETPIYGLLVTLIIIGIYTLLDRYQNIFTFIALIACLGISISGLISGKVLFLYPEAAEKLEFSQEQASDNTPIIYLYNSGSDYDWRIWASADELFSYPKVYFASQDSEDLIDDATIAQSSKLVVYIATGENELAQLERVLNSNKNVSSYSLKYEETFCNVYYLY